jgi:hypothetical protein
VAPIVAGRRVPRPTCRPTKTRDRSISVLTYIIKVIDANRSADRDNAKHWRIASIGLVQIVEKATTPGLTAVAGLRAAFDN